jgi:hypothetical protein
MDPLTRTDAANGEKPEKWGHHPAGGQGDQP